MNANINANLNVYQPATAPQSSTAGFASSAGNTTLQRGKACLPCRRRKMKCDSARPVCSPCLRGERAEDCEYTDGQRRPLTLTLEDEIARLRARVQELENPEATMPSVELYAPYAGASASSSASSSSASVRQARSRVPSPASYNHAAGPRQPASRGSPSDDTAEQSRADIEADLQLHAARGLSVIAPHAAELGFFLDLDRLRCHGTHALPALKSALTLWSIAVTSASSPDPADAHERNKILKAALISRTQAQLASALAGINAEPEPAMVLHIIQTGVLLAYYMQLTGQVVAARYHASGTWTLMVMLGLHRSPYLSGDTREGVHQATPGSGTQGGSTCGNTNMAHTLAFAGCAGLAQRMDGIEAEERIRAFWAVYALDRWLGLVCGVPFQSLAVDGNTGDAMTVPWPGKQGIVETRSNVIQHFLDDLSHDSAQDDASTIHAKASVLLGEAVKIAKSFVSDPTLSQSATFRAHLRTSDALLQRCLSVAITLATASHGDQPQMQEQAHALVTVHLNALALVILHEPFVATHGLSRQRTVEGALSVVRVLNQVGGAWAKGGISPIYAVVWTALCLTLHEELLRLRARPNVDMPRYCEEGELVTVIRQFMSVLSTFSQRCPARFFAACIEAMLPVLGSIAI